MDRELTRAELDELLPLFALDALDGEEREQIARYVARDDAARAELLSLREAAAMLAIAVLGIQVARQQDRIDELAAEMHRDPLEQQATAALASTDAHVIRLDAATGSGHAEVVMLPDGTGYFMDHDLPKLAGGSTYQLWAMVGDAAASRMVSLGVLGAEPGIVAFRVAAPTIMFEVTEEGMPGSSVPGDAIVMSGQVT